MFPEITNAARRNLTGRLLDGLGALLFLAAGFAVGLLLLEAAAGCGNLGGTCLFVATSGGGVG